MLWPANMTRPDIAFHCSKLATFCHSASKEHVYYAYCIVGYLVKTSHLGITYGGRLKIPRSSCALQLGYLSITL